jgi:hypothetical protein
MSMGFRIVLGVIVDWSVQFLAAPISFTNSFREIKKRSMNLSIDLTDTGR